MKSPKGKAAFLNYYRKLFSGEREFQEFLSALAKPNLPILRVSPQNLPRLWQLWHEKGLSWQPLSWYPYALLWPEEVSYGQLLPGFKQKLFYPMNAASLIPVLALKVEPADLVLDACAAPGGKTLFLAEFLDNQNQLFANDVSSKRLGKLKEILRQHGVFNVNISCRQAATLFRQFPEFFDKILLDVPCSSEKHVFGKQEYLKRWTRQRIKILQKRQLALLCGLLLALKPGGRLVYSTCAVTPDENEQVVARFLKKKKAQVRLCPWELKGPGGAGLAGEYGFSLDLKSVRRVWPQKEEGLDPMFVAVFEKTVTAL